MLFQCWASVEDGGPTLKQHRVNASCVLGQRALALPPISGYCLLRCNGRLHEPNIAYLQIRQIIE